MWRSSSGFTLLEVLVGMSLMGICLAVMLGLVADNLRLAQKITVKNKKLFLAVNKAEEAYLGILGEKFELVGDKKVWSGMGNGGLPWKVVEETGERREETILYDVRLKGFNLQGVRIQRQDASLSPRP